MLSIININFVMSFSYMYNVEIKNKIIHAELYMYVWS